MSTGYTYKLDHQYFGFPRIFCSYMKLIFRFVSWSVRLGKASWQALPVNRIFKSNLLVNIKQKTKKCALQMLQTKFISLMLTKRKQIYCILHNFQYNFTVFVEALYIQDGRIQLPKKQHKLPYKNFNIVYPEKSSLFYRIKLKNFLVLISNLIYLS